LGLVMSDEIVTQFVELFRGRGDCYGSDAGSCVRSPLNKDVFRSHLEGGPSIGVYPAVPTDTQAICAWGCSDIDVEDLDAARLLQRTLNAAGIHAWVERSRSKGYHVWVFASSPVAAEDMRRMLLVAHQVADYPAREVNPKQSDVSVSKVGNYVRIPYPGGLLGLPERRVMLDDSDNKIPLVAFVRDAYAHRTDPDSIRRIATMYVPPVKKHVVIDWDTDESLDDALRLASPLARTIWRDGPLPSQDRSTALMRLAHVCCTSGITPSMCHAIVVDADKRWGKYHARGEAGAREISKIVERAYGSQ
jgi:hypothetical protein